MSQPTTDDTAFAVVLVTALVGAWILWGARCGLLFHRLEDQVDEQLTRHQAAQDKSLADALTLILRSCLPDILDFYFGLGYVGPTPLSPKDLRTAAEAIDLNPDAADLYGQRLVTRPVSIALMRGIITALPEITPKLSNQGAPYEGLLRLRCFVGEYEHVRGQAKVLAWRFGSQCLATVIILPLALAAIFQKVEAWPIAFVAAVAIAHGISAELALHALLRRTALMPPLLNAGVQ